MVAGSLRGADGAGVSVQAAYRANYDKIARDHIKYWRETGKNPFQEEGTLARNENATVEIAKKHMPRNAHILDAGCGMGDLLLRFPSHERCGIDMSREYVEVANQRGLNVTVGKVEKLPWPKQFFSAVFATDVLEHVLDLNRAVKEMLRVLRKGGVLVVRTPNEEVLPLDNAPYEFVHLRRFDHPTMHLLFGKIFGCEVLEVAVSEQEDVIHAVVRK